jgi:hypothetical protein
MLTITVTLTINKQYYVWWYEYEPIPAITTTKCTTRSTICSNLSISSTKEKYNVG